MSSSSNSKKRERDVDEASNDNGSPTTSKGAGEDGSGGSTTNFRNVSACNRCRTRKNRCDQKLPRCTGCEKANVKCVGFDPVSKRAIPRSYVYYLETRVRSLEGLLRAHSIPFQPPEDDFSISEDIKPGQNVPFPVLDEDPTFASGGAAMRPLDEVSTLDPALREQDEQKLNKLATDVGLVSVHGSSKAKPTPGLSFARVVYAAVKSSVASQPASEKGDIKPSRLLPTDAADGGGTSMRDSFFGLHTKPTIKPAPWPDKELGQRLVDLYFEYANPQIPILHRGEFMTLFDRVYSIEPKRRTARELYLLNIVFAIGSGIIMDSSNPNIIVKEETMDTEPPTKKRPRMASFQHQPEEYHSSAVVHLEGFLGSSPASERTGGGLEELQAVLLLAGFALLRPVPPGLWYIIGVAVRLAIDLGLHFEEIDPRLDNLIRRETDEMKALGRKQWARDFRRRLWWCVYTFDRLVSTCVGRPFGITDQVVTTEFPSLLDDKYITTSGFLKAPQGVELPSYKLVAHHYFRLRLLQSEILQVLQYRQAEQARFSGANSGNAYIHKHLKSPFLDSFSSFRDWRSDIDARLWAWKESAPKQAETGVAFTPLFLELNYWQAIILLYRQSLAVPEQLAGELSPSTGGDVQSPGSAAFEAKEDEQMVFMKVAQAGQTVLKIYRQLHRLKLVNYTFLATHHLFMSGISFLYAIWHSPLVRSQLTLDDVDFTVLIATSVLSDLMEKCPPAEACRDAFLRMSKATISMVEKDSGFGNASTLGSQRLDSQGGYFGRGSMSLTDEPVQRKAPKRQNRMPMPKFDMNLKDLFSEEEIANRPVTHPPRMQNFEKRQPDVPMSFDTSQLSSGQMLMQSPSPHTSPQPGFAAADQSSPNMTFQLSNQQPYQPFAETIAQSQPEFAFDDMSWLDSFIVADPNANTWGNWNGANDLDLSFGTGGSGGLDSGGNWDSSGVDMLGGLFFGGDMNGNGF